MTNDSYKDSFRKPEKLLEFAGLQEDHKVLDVCTGFGYLARHIALKTKRSVDAQNGSEMMSFLESFGMQSIAMEMEERYDIHHFFAPMEDPALSQVGVYDLITMQNCFHDLYDMPINRRKFFRSIRRALKPGGRFLLVGNRAGPDRPNHYKIDEAVARGELAANGFVVIKSSDLFRQHSETSAWGDSNGIDRFVLLCEEAI